jgi:predicted MFS family arabinose efflux permease
MTSTPVAPFVRDRFTWLAYFMLAYYAYLQATLGPLMNFVRADLNLDYNTTGLHLSALALGMVLAGLSADRAARRWGRQAVFWGGGAGMALGAVLLTLGKHPLVTIGGCFVMGFIGSFLLVMIQAALTDRHGDLRAIALTESNIAAVFFSGLAPLFVGRAQAWGLGWQSALYLGVMAWLLMLGMFRAETIPVSHPSDSAKVEQNQPLPRAFWAYWIVIFLCVSVEWCILFWGANFLEKVVGFQKSDAASLMTVFGGAMVIGRFLGSRLTRRYNISLLLLIALFIVTVGFPLFWLPRAPVINVIGLFIAGIGVANLFPFNLAAATSIAPQQSNTASARISVGNGLAILLTPQVLGSLADRVGIQNAYGIVPVFVVAALGVVFFASRRMKKSLRPMS